MVTRELECLDELRQLRHTAGNRIPTLKRGLSKEHVEAGLV